MSILFSIEDHQEYLTQHSFNTWEYFIVQASYQSNSNGNEIIDLSEWIVFMGHPFVVPICNETAMLYMPKEEVFEMLIELDDFLATVRIQVFIQKNVNPFEWCSENWMGDSFSLWAIDSMVEELLSVANKIDQRLKHLQRAQPNTDELDKILDSFLNSDQKSLSALQLIRLEELRIQIDK